MFWPRYKQKSKFKLYLIQVLGGLCARGFWTDFLTAVAIYAISIVVIFCVPVPFCDRTISRRVVENWWLLDFLDKFLTGYGLGNGSIFSLGLFAAWTFNIKLLFFRDFAKAKRFTKTDAFIITLFSIFIVAWFIRNGIVKFKMEYIAISMSLIFLGALISRFFEVELQDLGFGGLANLFVVIILFKFIGENIRHGNHLKLLFIALLLIFTLPVVLYLLRKKLFIPIWNISGKDFEKSAFPVPFIEHRLLCQALYSTFFYTVLVFAFFDIIKPMTVFPTSSSWLVFLVMIVISLLIYWCYRTPNPIFSRFDPEDISDVLKSDYWTFEEIRPGKETSIFLSTFYKKMVRRSFACIFFLLTSIFISWYLYSFSDNVSHLFRYGQIGLGILLLNLSHTLTFLPNKILKYGRSRLSKYGWEYGLSGGRMMEIITPSTPRVSISVEEIVLRFIDPIYVDSVKELLARCETKIDLLRILPIIINYTKKDYEQPSLSRIVFSFLKTIGACLALSIFLFSIIGILMKLFYSNMQLNANEYFSFILSFVAFWIGLSFTMLAWIYPDAFKYLRKLLKKKKN
jgi:hypothetical protein